MNLNHPLQHYVQVTVTAVYGKWNVVVWMTNGTSETFAAYDAPDEAHAARRRLTRQIRALRRLLGWDVSWLPLGV